MPPYRADVTRDVDVIEDILRIYGYNRVPLSPAITFSLPVKKNDPAPLLREQTAGMLSAQGAYEMMSNPLTRSRYFEGQAWVDTEAVVKLLSSINTELDVMRPHMFWTGLESVAMNLNHKNTGIVLYEFGHTYSRQGSEYREEEVMALYAAGIRSQANWHTPQRMGDFYYLKSMIALLFGRWGIGHWETVATDAPWLDYGLDYRVGKTVLARVGKLSSALSGRFDIKQEVAYAECYWQPVTRIASGAKGGYREINRFPAVRRDLALLLDKEVPFSRLETLARKQGGKILQQVGLFDVYEGEKVGKGKIICHKLSFRHPERTLTDEEVDAVVQQLVQIYQQETGATLR